MIELKDLKNREVKNNETIKFDYDLEFQTNDQGKLKIPFTFEKVIESTGNEWKILVRLKPTQEKESQIYEFNYMLPKQNVQLVLVTATGLRLFQMILQEEIQDKSLIDFEIGNLIQSNIEKGL